MSSDSASSEEPDSPEAAPASPDYVPGPKEPEQAPLSLDYMPGPEYPEYLAPSDEEIPMEDQPYADGPVDYPADGGDGDDDDSSDDDEVEEEASKEEEVEEEEDEHLAPADSVVDHVPSFEETEPFETDESAPTPRSPQTIIPFSQTRLRRARKTVRLEPPMSPSMEARIAELCYGTLHHLSPPHLHYHLGILYLPCIPLSPYHLLPSFTSFYHHREDTLEAELPPRKRLCLTALTLGFVGTLDAKPDDREPWQSAMGSEILGIDRHRFIRQFETVVDDSRYHYDTADSWTGGSSSGVQDSLMQLGCTGFFHPGTSGDGLGEIEHLVRDQAPLALKQMPPIESARTARTARVDAAATTTALQLLPH
ncbi:hypothetical protein Tco_0287363 [Tanacetum coccineum]